MEKKKKRTHEEFMQFIREKKERDGRLNKLGEWLLSTGGNTGYYIKDENLRFVMK